ncbi:TIR domain-containing protein [Cupriavidus necator]|uniref:nSTAND1 domain-containing NTPase n=1 Tax=Cupriavidus necator TaxID=106590 RepID=UPI0039C07E35
MSRIFISHSSANNALALAVGRWLSDKGWDDYFLDLEPTKGLAPGERWQEALRNAAGRCEAVLFLISPAWRDSRWCLAEFLLAKQLGKTIFGVLVEAVALDALPKEMTAEWHLCDLVSGDQRLVFRVSHDPIVAETNVSFGEAGLARLKLGLQRAGLDPSNFPWPPADDVRRPPYPGLRALGEKDAAVFFGREAAVVRALDTLRTVRERGTERMFVVVGASGAGKSSFLRAGLWPRLRRDDRTFLPLPVIRPERAVLHGAAGLVVSLEQVCRELGSTRTRAEIRHAIQTPGAVEQLLGEIQVLHSSRLGPGVPVPTIMICIDQGEELFGVEGQGESQQFMSLLARILAPAQGEDPDAIDRRKRALAVVAIRTDSYEQLQTEPTLRSIAPQVFSLPPIERVEFKAVIEGPAARATGAGHKLTIQPALTERLLQDAEGPDALPLLAFTLERLYTEYGSSGHLRLEDYQALGGVRGSIDAAVEAAFADPQRQPAVPAGKADLERLLRQGLIPWLARVDPQTEEPQRRVARWDELPEAAHAVLERLIEQRLLLRDRRKIEGGGDEVTVVEVAHEALLRQWPTLTTWLDADADALKTLDAVQRAADEWQRNARGQAWLVHTGERLTSGEALRERNDFRRLLGPDGLAYLGACRERDAIARAEREGQLKRELEQAKALAESQRQRADEQAAARIRQRRLSLTLFALVVLAVGTALYGWQQKRAAEQQGQVALSRQLAAQAVSEIGRDRQLALLLAVAAHRTVPAYETRSSLEKVLTAPPHFRTFLSRQPGEVRSVAFSPDGRTLATADSPGGAGEEGTVILWDVARRIPLGEPLTGHQGGVWSVAFSHDGRTLASAGMHGTVILWDVARHTPLGEPLTGHQGGVWSVIFSPDGRTLASAGDDGTVILWDVAHRTPLGDPLRVQNLSSVAFSPDGRTLATGDNPGGAGEEGTVVLWDVARRTPLGEPLRGHQGGVWSVAYSPDGRTLASAGDDGTVILWDVAHRTTLGKPLSGQGRVLGLTFSPDGRTLATAVFLTPAMVTLGNPGAGVILWDVDDRTPLGEPLDGRQDGVWSVAFSPDGTTLASAGKNGTVILWDVDRPPLGERLGGNAEHPVWDVAFSPDGGTLAVAGAQSSADRDNTVILWDVPRRTPLGDPLRGQKLVSSVAFSPDGRTLAVAGAQSAADRDNTVILWDVASRTPLGEPLTGHQGGSSVAFSPDGRTLAVAGTDGTVILWDVAHRTPLGDPLRSHRGGVSSLAFSPDGRTLAVAGAQSAADRDNTVILWDVAHRTPLGDPLRGHQGPVLSIAFRPDGRTLASAGQDGTVILWDVAHRTRVSEPFTVYQGRSVESVAFSPDGTTLASAGEDGPVTLWDVAHQTMLGEPLQGHDDHVRGIAFSPDGRTLASAGGGVGILWDVDSVSWMGKACALANRNLTHREWARYVGAGVRYQAPCPDLPVPTD